MTRSNVISAQLSNMHVMDLLRQLGFGIISFTSVSKGTYNLVFKLNGTTYQGSVTVADTSCTITWSYSSGVTISPLTIQKQ